MLSIKLLACLVVILVGNSSGNAQQGNPVTIENFFFKYEINPNGVNKAFIDKESGKDYLLRKKNSKMASIVLNEKTKEIISINAVGNVLTMRFEDVNESAQVKLTPQDNHVIFEVVKVPKGITSFNILNVPLELDGQPYEPFSACVLSLNLNTHVRQLPPLQTHLWANSYAKFGLVGAKFALLGLPQKMNLPVIREVMEKDADLPLSKEGGAWAQMNKEGYGSYLMNFGTLTEETVDEWIETCKTLGFNQIDSHGGGDFFEFGSLELNKKKWPDGWESFKRINNKLHENGISHIFHTYAFFIDKQSKLVHGVPHKDLGYVDTFTLVNDLDENATEIIVKESTANISTLTGFHTENSVTLRFGDELIEFAEVHKSPPYKFLKLRRGANGTKVTSHQKGSVGYHLSERFGRFVPGPYTPLFDELAKKHAEIINQCKFDGLYLDAIDGSAVLGGKDDFWYYGTKFILKIAEHLDRKVGMEMSSMVHHWWHYRSRWQAWDRPVRGYKRFIDIHLASIKAPSLFLPDRIESNEWEHGIWKGHTPLIDKYAGVEWGQTKLPLHLGWWGNQTWDPPQVEPTFPDDIEYLAGKMLANNAGYSQLGGVDKKLLDSVPMFKQAAEIFKKYESLRQQNYFDDHIRQILRQPGKEFKLVKQADSSWNFKPVAYIKHKTGGNQHESADWKVINSFKQQPLKVRIEALMSVASFDDPEGVELENRSGDPEFLIDTIAKGIQASFKQQKVQDAKHKFITKLTAKNTGIQEASASYINFEKKFKAPLNLSKNQGIGVWVNGDGSGQLLNISLRSPLHISHGAHGDRFVKIDFKGWKYVELVEIESAAISDYSWPDDSHFYVYDSYRHTLDFSQIESLQLWLNNLPQQKQTNTVLGAIKALPLRNNKIINPTLQIGGQKITFPVSMPSGTYLELAENGKCILYGTKGEVLQEITLTDKIPMLLAGENHIQFLSDPTTLNPRTQVTIISEGEPLKKELK